MSAIAPRRLLSWLPPSWAIWIYTVILRPAPLRSLAQKIICKIIPETIDIGGVTLVLNRDDAIVSGNLALGCYETFNLELFRKMLRPGMHVLDVGANIGLYSAIAAKAVGATGRVIAIEPDPNNVRFLKLTRDRNELTNLAIIQKAAGDENRQAFLYLCDSNKADHRTYDEPSRKKIPIEMTTVDSVVERENFDNVDVLKIDTQGFEMFVARGMANLVERSLDLKVMMEFWPWGIARAGGSPSALLEFFTSRGFSVSMIDDSHNRVIPLTDFGELLALKLERQHANLLLERTTRAPAAAPSSQD
jgi:FkbM family methyltransferase